MTQDPTPSPSTLAWRAVSEGERSAAELVEERRAAGDTAERIERDRQLFTPLDDAEHDAITAGLRARLERRTAAPATREPLAAVPSPAAPAATAPPPNEPSPLELLDPEPSTSRRTRTAAVGAAVLALAAGLLAWVWLDPTQPPTHDARSDNPDLHAQASPPALPPYRIEPHYNIPKVRAAPAPIAPDEPLRYPSDGRFEWNLRPLESVGGPVSVHVWLRDDGGTRELECEVLRDETSGALSISGEVSRLRAKPGRVTVHFELSREPAPQPDPRTLQLEIDVEAPLPDPQP